MDNDVNPFHVDDIIFMADLDNIIPADDLAPCVTRSSSVMILIMQDKQFLVILGVI